MKTKITFDNKEKEKPKKPEVSTQQDTTGHPPPPPTKP